MPYLSAQNVRSMEYRGMLNIECSMLNIQPMDASWVLSVEH